ncbi:MAG TPA: cystatin domain-containing protein [Humisphaera sp.]
MRKATLLAVTMLAGLTALAQPRTAVAIPAAAPAVPGGQNEAAADDPAVVAAANFAVEAQQKALAAEGRKETLTLVKVVSARKQVVAGMNYFLTLRVKLGDQERTATATVYERAWEKKITLTKWAFEEK